MNLDVLAEHGMINPADLTLFRYADDAEAIWQLLVEAGLKAHTGPLASEELSGGLT